MILYNINLLPPELQKDASIDTGKLKKMLAIAGVCLIVLVSYGGFVLSIYSLGGKIEDVKREIAVLEPQAKKFDQFLQERQQISKKAEAMEKLLVTRVGIFPILNDLNHNLPVDVTITSVSFGYAEKAPDGGYASVENISPKDKPQAETPVAKSPAPAAKAKPPQGQQPNKGAEPPPNLITIQGLAQSQSSVGVLINSLKNLPYVKMVRLTSVIESKYGQISDFTVQAYLYERG